jgi:BirA family biotin operon repressor/biotin-[acetyl-CoA-carboxylase] ligase
MNQQELENALSNPKLGGIRYFETIGSTNDEALAWAKNGARDFSIVIANEQTSGRGRLNRSWFTPPNSALAMSLILRPTRDEKPYLTRTVGLAALAIADSLRMMNLDPQIKWPNDILLYEHKVAGILTESVWVDDELESLVIGMGINVKRSSIPDQSQLNFPATSLEAMLGYAPSRVKLAQRILTDLFALRPHMGTDSFIRSWEKNLAFLGEQVQVEERGEIIVSGKVDGLESDGGLRLSNDDGKSITVRFGDVRVRLIA